MKRFVLAVTMCGLVLTFGFISSVADPLQDRPPDNGMRDLATNTITSVPDMENIPLYPGSKIVSVAELSSLSKRISYNAPDDNSQVLAFYNSILPKYGWILLTSDPHESPIYSWIDPHGVLPWNLEVSIATERYEGGKLGGVMILRRWPNIDKLPIYSDARDLEVVTSEDQANGYPVHATVKSYLTSVEPAEIASYYNSVLLSYGWEFYDLSGRGQGPSTSQLGDITSPVGLQFASRHHGMGGETTIGITLSIVATPTSQGRTRIQLKIVESERVIRY